MAPVYCLPRTRRRWKLEHDGAVFLRCRIKDKEKKHVAHTTNPRQHIEPDSQRVACETLSHAANPFWHLAKSTGRPSGRLHILFVALTFNLLEIQSNEIIRTRNLQFTSRRRN